MDSQDTNPNSPSASPVEATFPVKNSRTKNGKHPEGRSNTDSTAGRLACDICRERKVRCDRAEPKCGRCTRLDNKCSYHGRTGYRASQADLPRQLSQLQDRLAQAEARLPIPPSSPMTPSLGTTTELPWQLVSAYEPQVESDRDALMQSQMFVRESTLAEFDRFTNTTMEAQDPSGSDFDWTSMVRPIPEMIPSQEPLGFHTPMDECGPSIGVNNAQDDLVRPCPSHRTQGEDELPLQEMRLLHCKYFEVFYLAMPILSMRRFKGGLAMSPSSSPIRSLSYAVALIGTTVSPDHACIQQTCYNAARKYVELCERDEEGTDLASLNVFQALLFIIRYELTSKRFTRAWMTIGRALRLAKMLNLHQMDRVGASEAGSSDLHFCLPRTHDPASLEERRRSFWALFIFEGYASTRTGVSCQLCEAQICVALPSPGYLTEDFTPAPVPLLSGASDLGASLQISSYTGIVLMVALARRSYEHVWVLAAGPQNQGFWDSHYALVKIINCRIAMLHMHLNAKAVAEDPVAFTLHVNLYAVDIFLHEAAIDEVEKQGLPKLVAAESIKRSTAAAFKISSAVRMNWPGQRSERDIITLQGVFIGWPLVMGITAFSRDLLDSEETTSNSVADSLRLLLTALNHVEEPGGYWHRSIASVEQKLKEWDDKQGGFHMGAWSAAQSNGQWGQLGRP